MFPLHSHFKSAAAFPFTYGVLKTLPFFNPSKEMMRLLFPPSVLKVYVEVAFPFLMKRKATTSSLVSFLVQPSFSA